MLIDWFTVVAQIINFLILVALLMARVVPAADGGRAAIAGVFLALLPAGIASLMLFDYGQTKNMNGAESGCDDWLLRMPIASWKIAFAPIVLKTLWIVGIWCVFALTATYFGFDEESLPSFFPAVVFFSGAMVWVLFLAWRPFRSGWWRMGLIICMIPAIYLDSCRIGEQIFDRLGRYRNHWKGRRTPAHQRLVP